MLATCNNFWPQITFEIHFQVEKFNEIAPPQSYLSRNFKFQATIQEVFSQVQL